MKIIIRNLIMATLCLAMHSPSAFGQLNVPSDGSDGALNITNDTVIDLSLATTNHVWGDNNATNAGNGVYDPVKWAVVFKYSSINIAADATVTFLNHPSHAPVVWLVQSNATINGSVSLDGGSFITTYPGYLLPTEPAPGGFRGGAYGQSGYGGGYGPGGGDNYDPNYGSSYGSGYGNPQILPLMGGSGAGAHPSTPYVGTYDGASGAGAILVVVGGITTINGQITANGLGYNYNSYGIHADLGGSGAIRLVATQIQGSGIIQAAVVRTEASAVSDQLVITPNTVAIPPGTTPIIWPATNSPTVTVVSVNQQSAPVDPLAAVATSSDVSISTNGAVSVVLQSQNFPPNGSVVLRVLPKYADYYSVNATYVSGTFSNATWVATTTLPQGFCVLQAHATSP